MGIVRCRVDQSIVILANILDIICFILDLSKGFLVEWKNRWMYENMG
jgi:hypothetical protein